jgi:hypothetical protein
VVEGVVAENTSQVGASKRIRPTINKLSSGKTKPTSSKASDQKQKELEKAEE